MNTDKQNANTDNQGANCQALLGKLALVKLDDAEPKDKNALLAIAQKPEIMKFIGNGNKWSKDYMNSLKDDLLYYNWILKDKDLVVGYIGLRPFDAKSSEDGLQIRIFIYPGGKGYGTLALKELEKYTRGIRLWSIVEKNNEPSNKLFSKGEWKLVKTAFVYGKEHNYYIHDQLKMKDIGRSIYIIGGNYIDVGNKSLNHYMHFNYQQFKIYKSIPIPWG
jgi:RimJ/RimL family protein N-acetyltransferase